MTNARVGAGMTLRWASVAAAHTSSPSRASAQAPQNGALEAGLTRRVADGILCWEDFECRLPRHR